MYILYWAKLEIPQALHHDVLAWRFAYKRFERLCASRSVTYGRAVVDIDIERVIGVPDRECLAAYTARHERKGWLKY